MRFLLFLSAFLSFHLAIAGDPYRAASAVYKVRIDNGKVAQRGTGILIARDKVLTNCHVLNLPGGIFTVTNRVTGSTYKPSSYYNVGKYDACILVGVFPDGEPVPIASTVDVGQEVWFYGYPSGVAVDGHGPILRMVDDAEQGPIFESAAFCKPGSSGGPLLNAKGELVGLNFATRTFNGANFCLSIPVLYIFSVAN